MLVLLAEEAKPRPLHTPRVKDLDKVLSEHMAGFAMLQAQVYSLAVC